MSVGMTILAVAAAFLAGALVGWAGFRRENARLRRRVKTLQADGAEKKPETMKRVVWLCLGNGIAWVWCSYLLAVLDRTQIAESLSQVAVTEIIGVVLAYALKSLVENLSKNNRWPDKTEEKTDEPPEGGAAG